MRFSVVWYGIPSQKTASSESPANHDCYRCAVTVRAQWGSLNLWVAYSGSIGDKCVRAGYPKHMCCNSAWHWPSFSKLEFAFASVINQNTLRTLILNCKIPHPILLVPIFVYCIRIARIFFIVRRIILRWTVALGGSMGTVYFNFRRIIWLSTIVLFPAATSCHETLCKFIFIIFYCSIVGCLRVCFS